MIFTNNWATVLREPLDIGGESLLIDPVKMQELGPGVHRLTVTNELDALEQFSAVEIIDVEIDEEGGHFVTRGVEGTEPQSWVAGTYIYASITAGHMKEMYRLLGWAENVLSDQPDPEQIQILEAQVADLTQQLDQALLELGHCRNDLIACEIALDYCLSQGGGGEGVLVDHNGITLTDHSLIPLSSSIEHGGAGESSPILVDHNGIPLTDQGFIPLTDKSTTVR